MRLLNVDAPQSTKSDHSVLEMIHLGELIVAVNQSGICWSYNICKYLLIDVNISVDFRFIIDE